MPNELFSNVKEFKPWFDISFDYVKSLKAKLIPDMKVAVEINVPINTVVKLFMDKNNFKEWKKDFTSYENISGVAGEVGAVTKLIGKREVMYEKIISKNLPLEIIEVYEHKRNEKIMMVHKATNHFTSLSENKTLFEVETEIEKVNSFILK